MAASSWQPPRLGRPWSRQERVAGRWEEAPAGVALRDNPEEGNAKMGRLSVYAFNFGEDAKPSEESPLMAQLLGNKAHVFVGQEVTSPMAELLRAKGWHCSDERFIGPGRACGGDGVMIAARNEVAVGVETFSAVSGAFLAGRQERSAMLFARVQLRWAFAESLDYTFGSFHLHRETAKRGLGSPDLRRFIKALADGCRASGARILCGDANMGLFLVAPGLLEEGYECRLLMHHREVDILGPLPRSASEAVAALRYDSMGVWSIGPLSGAGVKRLTLSSRLLLGATHPAVGVRSIRSGRYKVLTRGYAKRSYLLPQFEEVPAQEDMDRVRLLWDLHGVELVGTDAPARSKQGAETWTVTREVSTAEGHWEDPAQRITATCAQHIMFEGERNMELWKANGLELTYEWVGPDAPAAGGGHHTEGWRPFPHIRELAANFRKWDVHGELWGLGSHFPIFFVIGSVRTKSAEGGALRKVAKAKIEQWKASGSWPWWVWHESERSYWLPGDATSGRGFSGYWWRHSLQGLSPRQREEKDAAWIALYGREAYDAAVLATEGVLELACPPEPDGTLSAAAASGVPQRWPWHVGQPLRNAEEAAEAREDHARSGAWPFASAGAMSRVHRSEDLRSRTPMAPRR